jgi:hypothetical protein
MSGSSLKVALVLSLAFNAAVMGAVVYGFARRPAPGAPREPVAGAELARGRCARLCKAMGVPPDRMVHFSREMAVSSEGMSEMRLRLIEARGQLADLLRAPEPDERAIMAKVDEISALQGDLEKALVQRLLKASSVLLPEERAKLMQFIGCRGIPCGRAGERGPRGDEPGPGVVPR